MSVSVAVIGECMLELTHSDHENAERTWPLNMSYGGDTLNAAIYLSRAHIDVSYVTGLGDDIMSDWLIDEWKNEGIDCSLVTCMPNSVPGMYMINVDENGERSFLYWRRNSPASRIFDNPDQVAVLLKSISSYDYVYLSGISLAILSSESRERLFNLLEKYRQLGGKLVFDGNYRPNLWPGVTDAQQAYSRMYQLTDVALPTLEDEAMLFGFTTAVQVMQSLRDHGVPEIVVKMGGDGCLALDGTKVKLVEARVVDPVDTTAAGDSFNAGYLGARLKGSSIIDACSAGHILASAVIQHRGAIIPATVED